MPIISNERKGVAYTYANIQENIFHCRNVLTDSGACRMWQ